LIEKKRRRKKNGDEIITNSKPTAVEIEQGV
jgi:hypothetical protein